MIAKTQFAKDQIIDAAFEIACEDGLEGITVRKVAQRLGSSIAPIYVNFDSVDELVQAAVHRTLDISQQLLAEQDSGDPFRDIGAASLRFAREYPQLFRDMVLKPNPHLANYRQEMDPRLLEQMQTDPRLAGFGPAELEEILLKMRVFHIGLSAMIANRLLPEEFDAEQSLRLLNDVSEDVIAGVKKKQESANSS